MMRPEQIVEIPFGWIVFAALLAVFVIFGLMAGRFDQKHRADYHEETLRSLVTLDPSLLVALGEARGWYDERRVLNEDEIQRLAKIKRADTRQRTDTTDVEEALAALAEARKDSSE